MRFGVFGPLEVTNDGGRKLALGGPKQRSVLAILLLRANEVVSQDRLAEELWPGRPSASSAATLQAHVSRLRRALGTDERIVTAAGGYMLRVAPGELDRDQFERLIEEGSGALASADWEQAAERLGEALALWRGPPLSDFQYDSFAQGEIARLSELHVGALEQRLEAELALGREERIVGDLERLVREHPFRERLRAQLMLALYRTGRQAEALEAYRNARAALVEELGIEPAAELRQLHEAILAQDPSLLLEPGVGRAPQAGAREPGPRSVEGEEPVSGREERKVVTIVSASFTLADEAALRDPEDVRMVLAPYHARVRADVGRFGGTVEKLIGGEVIAVFGAPIAHEDDPERAVRAALAVRDCVVDQDGSQVRIGVDTGEALIAIGPRAEASEALAAGNVVHAAARLQAAAPSNAILVGERTYRATRDAVEYGAAHEVGRWGTAWEAFSARGHTTSVGQLHTPLVGRARELDLLIATLARVTEGRSAQLVTLVGVPGIGKSRLVYELRGVAGREREPVTWRQGRSLPYGEGVTFWALGEMVKQHAGILESDSGQVTAERLARAVRALVEADADWIEAQLRPVVGLGTARDSSGGLSDAPAAWRRFFEALAERRPTVLVFEDLHWADEGLLDFIDDLVDRAIGVPLLVLATARPELLDRHPGWGARKPNALVLSLPPLAEDDAGRLVASLLDGRTIDGAMLDELVGRAGGNPLYAEQYARALLERGTLEQLLPESVHGIIAARLDALPDSQKRLLQDAAVVGRVFWLGSVEAIDGCSRADAEKMLYGLARKEFVRPVRRSSVAGEPEYAFSHILLRDVAYGQIPRAERSEKHQRAAAWIESLGRSDDHAEMLAHHYLGALEYAKAAGREDATLVERARIALQAAGDRALALVSYTAAARFYSAALELWPQSDPNRVWLLVQTGRAKHGADQTGTDQLKQAVEELQARGDLDDAAEVAVELARCFWIEGDRDPAYAYVERALELTAGRGRSRARAYALIERAGYHLNASEYPQAIQLVREALPLTEALAIEDLRVRGVDVLGASRVLAGDIGGLDDQRTAITLARKSTAFSRLVVAELNLYFLCLFQGQLTAAGEALGALRRDIESYGSADQRKVLRTALAHQAVLHGRWVHAVQLLDEAIAEAEAGGAHYEDPLHFALRASIALARGDLNGSSADSKNAVERARRGKDPQLIGPALTIRGMVLLAAGRPEEASPLASEILAGGAVLITALLANQLTVTPIEVAWLLRDLGHHTKFVQALSAAPSSPWVDTAMAIAAGDVDQAIKLVASIGAPSIEAYTRLRAAEAMVALGRRTHARHQLEQALVFYRSVEATRYVSQAENLLAA
jgi:DNA-binding SARP family transcriptional activator/class 3 adenylate cyclase